MNNIGKKRKNKKALANSVKKCLKNRIYHLFLNSRKMPVKITKKAALKKRKKPWTKTKAPAVISIFLIIFFNLNTPERKPEKGVRAEAKSQK